jgi:protein SCO1/2
MKRLALLALAGLLAACAPSAEEAPVAVVATPSNTTGFLGTTLDAPLPKPDVELTDTSGEPFTISEDTAGRVTALYIGYTHCPDVCPTTMADLSVAMGMLSPQEAKKVDVVMITSDPKRDTPETLGKWLGSFTHEAIGLTGRYKDIQAAAGTVGVFLDPPVKNPDGTVTVEHGAQVILFGKDDQSDLIFTSGFASEDVAHDLQRLLQE